MFKMKFVDLLLMIGVACLMSGWNFPLVASLPEDREKYCSDVLQQTEDQERNCAGAPLKFTSAHRSVIHLLCCLGVLPTFHVRHNYTSYLHRSLFLHIATYIQSPTDEKLVARFVRQCHGPNSHHLLDDNDYVNWLKDRSTCTV